MLFSNDLLFLTPELYWTFTMIAVLLFGVTLLSRHKLNLVTPIGYIVLYYILCFVILYLHLPTTQFALFNFQFLSDEFTFYFKFIFLAILAICLYSSLNYFSFERIFFTEYYFLVGFFCLSAFMLVSANDMLLFYLAIELQSLILYTLAAFKRYSVFSTESGLKYFVLGAFSSGLLLFGISLFYGFFGTINFFDIKFLVLSWSALHTNFAVNVAIVFFLSAVLFKLAAAPFHVWAPDVYDGAPTPIVLIFATLPKLALFGFILKLFVYFLYDFFSVWYVIFSFAGLLSVLLGTVVALNQLSIKRLYAYSAIVNVGYLITAISYGTFSSFIATFNYLLIYVISTISIFLVILMFRAAFGFKKIKYLPDYKTYATYSMIFATTLSFIFFSLAGIPPLAGFFIKFFLFKSIMLNDFMLNPAFFIILVTSVVSAFYYIRVVRFIFFDTGRAPQLFLPLNYKLVFIFMLLNFLIIFFLFFQQLLLLGLTYIVGSVFL